MEYEQKLAITYRALRAIKHLNDDNDLRLTYFDLLQIFGNDLWQFTDNDFNNDELDTDDKLCDVSEIKVVYDEVHFTFNSLNLEAMEREAIKQALRLSNNVQKNAAWLLGITPRVICHKIKTHGISYEGQRERSRFESDK